VTEYGWESEVVGEQSQADYTTEALGIFQSSGIVAAAYAFFYAARDPWSYNWLRPDNSSKPVVASVEGLLLPVISSFTPSSGPVGSSVTITGSSLGGATAVTFNRTTASSYQVDSPTQITATVPAGASSGRIKVSTPTGTAISTSRFTITAAPSLSK
jgi:hypothetical protein